PAVPWESVLSARAGPPKEQPPRNLSGKRTASRHCGHSGKRLRPGEDHRRCKRSVCRARLSGFPTEGATVRWPMPGVAAVCREDLMSEDAEPQDIATLPLDAWHRAKGARM